MRSGGNVRPFTEVLATLRVPLVVWRIAAKVPPLVSPTDSPSGLPARVSIVVEGGKDRFTSTRNEQVPTSVMVEVRVEVPRMPENWRVQVAPSTTG